MVWTIPVVSVEDMAMLEALELEEGLEWDLETTRTSRIHPITPLRSMDTSQ